MKTAGFILIQISALLFCFLRLRSERLEAELLRSFCAMLEQLRGMLSSEASPMPELLTRLARCSEGRAAAFLGVLSDSMEQLGEKSFLELWESALCISCAALCPEAVKALKELGAVLGRYELDIQLDALSACHQTLRGKLDALRRELPGRKRLTYGLSLSASMLLGILLL